MRLLMILFLALSPGCMHNSGSVAATAAAVPPPTPVDPVHFSTGSSRLAGEDDYVNVGAAAAQLKANSRLYVVLTGFTDAGGSVETNQALSQARSDYVADLLRQAGCDDRRIYTRGMGELVATGQNAQLDRRVEFVFYGAGSGEIPTADQVLASAGIATPGTSAGSPPASSGTPASSASSTTSARSTASTSTTSAASGSNGERKVMEVIGIPDLDSFFGKGQALLTKLQTNQDRIADARASLEQVLGVAAGADLQTALTELKQSAAGAITVTMVGTKPRVAVKPGMPPTVGSAVTAINGLVDSMVKASADLATLPQDAMALVSEAKALPAKVPSMAQAAGVKTTQIPKVLKNVKKNISLLASIPGETKSLVSEVTSTFKLIQQTFVG